MTVRHVQGLKLLAPVVRKLGPDANPAKLKEIPVKGLLVWAFYTGPCTSISASPTYSSGVAWLYVVMTLILTQGLVHPVAGYMAFIFASSSLPGVPVWQTPPEVIMEILLDSVDFFFINSGLTALGLSAIPAPSVSFIFLLMRSERMQRVWELR